MKVWITRYALSEGISEKEVVLSEGSPNMVLERPSFAHYHKPDWHETKESAIERAEQMRIKKIASLKKQIAKLEKLDFERGAI